MDKILEMLNKAMENARILAIVQFDPALFLFTSALQMLIRKGQEYQANKNKKRASDIRGWVLQAAGTLHSLQTYLDGGTEGENS